MIERKLKIDLGETIDVFQGFRWKFYDVLDDVIRVEAKREGDLLVVELPFSKEAVTSLKREGFILQAKRRVVE